MYSVSNGVRTIFILAWRQASLSIQREYFAVGALVNTLFSDLQKTAVKFTNVCNIIARAKPLLSIPCCHGLLKVPDTHITFE